MMSDNLSFKNAVIVSMGMRGARYVTLFVYNAFTDRHSSFLQPCQLVLPLQCGTVVFVLMRVLVNGPRTKSQANGESICGYHIGILLTDGFIGVGCPPAHG